MWKAILVLFVTSSTQPISMMIGHFPETYVKKSECQAFIARVRGDIDGTMAVLASSANLGFKVLHHDMSCFEDNSGDPV